jgi:hypothetical protein
VSETRLPRFHALCQLLHAPFLNVRHRRRGTNSTKFAVAQHLRRPARSGCPIAALGWPRENAVQFREAKFFVAEKIEQTRNLHVRDASRRRLRSMHYIKFETAKV